MIKKLYEDEFKVNIRKCKNVTIGTEDFQINIVYNSKKLNKLMEEMNSLKTVFCQNVLNENLIEIVLDLDIQKFDKFKTVFQEECIKTTKPILCDMPTAGGVVIYDLLEDKRIIVVDWMGIGFFIGSIKSNQFYIVGADISNEFISMVKYFITAPFVQNGDIALLHASTVNYKNKNYIIIGESGKGKTSLTILFCSEGGSIVSEDISYILRNGNCLNLRSREYFTLRQGTLAEFKDLFQDLKIDNDFSKEKLFKLGKEKQLRVSIDRLSKNGNIDNAKINYLIIPELTDQIVGYEVKEVSEQNIISIINEANRCEMTAWINALLSFNLKGPFDCSKVLNKTKGYYLKTDLNYRKRFSEIMKSIF